MAAAPAAAAQSAAPLPVEPEGAAPLDAALLPPGTGPLHCAVLPSGEVECDRDAEICRSLAPEGQKCRVMTPGCMTASEIGGAKVRLICFEELELCLASRGSVEAGGGKASGCAILR